MAQRGLPPGPRFGLAQALLYRHDPARFLRRARARYGDMITVPYPFGKVVYVCEPSVVKAIFTGDPAVYRAEGNVTPLEPFVGPRSVFLLEDDDHIRSRKLLLPPFHGDRIRRYEQTFAEMAAEEVDGWRVGDDFAMRTRMQSLTLDIFVKTVFGVRDHERRHRFRDLLLSLTAAAWDFMIWEPRLRVDFGRLSPWGRFMRLRRAVEALVEEESERRRADPKLAERDDVLSILMQATDDGGGHMGNAELYDQLMTLLIAGHETTATGLAWLFERVTRNPRVEERLREELETGGHAYLDAAVKEALRTGSVVSATIRLLARDVELGGYLMPAGTYVAPALLLMHSRPDFHPEPDEFRPERFLDRGGTEPYGWVPFGGGTRRCIGASFAQLEMRVIAREILRRTKLEAPDPRPERPRMRHVTVVPVRGGRVVVRELLDAPRETAAAREPERSRAIMAG